MTRYEKVNYIGRESGNGLMRYEKDLLTLRLCDSFFPVSFIEEKNGTKGIFDCSGYERICRIEELQCMDFLSMISSMVSNMIATEKHCIFGECLDLRVENCYVNLKNWDTKFLYIRDSNRIPFREKVLRIMKFLETKVEEKEVFDKAIRIVEENESNRIIVGHLESLKREFYETKF